jgi:hypothetical protein
LARQINGHVRGAVGVLRAQLIAKRVPGVGRGVRQAAGPDGFRQYLRKIVTGTTWSSSGLG